MTLETTSVMAQSSQLPVFDENMCAEDMEKMVKNRKKITEKDLLLIFSGIIEACKYLL